MSGAPGRVQKYNCFRGGDKQQVEEGQADRVSPFVKHTPKLEIWGYGF